MSRLQTTEFKDPFWWHSHKSNTCEWNAKAFSSKAEADLTTIEAVLFKNNLKISPQLYVYQF